MPITLEKLAGRSWSGTRTRTRPKDGLKEMQGLAAVTT
jgi:hypothetical protein